MKDIKALEDELLFKRRNIWESADEAQKDKIFKFSDEYMDFLNCTRTPQQSIKKVTDYLKSCGFVDFSKDNRPDRVYQITKDKSLAVFCAGEAKVQEGLNILAAHIDSPRIDIKQNPLYQEHNVALFKTHYYGGIKNYQWYSTPLCLCGTIITNEGKELDIQIGLADSDPVFVIPDLLPHLSRKAQDQKKVSEAFDANKLNLVFSSIPITCDGEKKVDNAIKLGALNLLKQKYGICEKDLFSAELCLTPAVKARSAGLDASMVAGYGQDDKLCVFTQANVLAKTKINAKSCAMFLLDREEIGSQGNTSASSPIVKNFIRQMLKANGEPYDSLTLDKTIANSQILSGDVGAAVNPNFTDVHDIQNASYINCGIEVIKYTGFGGKYSASEASGKFVAKLLHLWDREKIHWQVSSLGKVDMGGGGTIAKYLANLGADVLDCGVGLMSIHSLCELAGKADIYELYKAFDVFLKKA